MRFPSSQLAQVQISDFPQSSKSSNIPRSLFSIGKNFALKTSTFCDGCKVEKLLKASCKNLANASCASSRIIFYTNNKYLSNSFCKDRFDRLAFFILNPPSPSSSEDQIPFPRPLRPVTVVGGKFNPTSLLNHLEKTNFKHRSFYNKTSTYLLRPTSSPPATDPPALAPQDEPPLRRELSPLAKGKAAALKPRPFLKMLPPTDDI
jgi:hypothetical protein